MSKFQQENSLQKREKESKRIRNKYPDRIPLICEKDCREKIVNDIDKKKYLVPTDLTLGQFVYIIGKRIKINPEKAIFIFIGFLESVDI